ncbi:MAG TPA: site-2 protease family protein [Anaeromyxobacter sp.]|nr:site-2 protease family protein [Anaeromyxobacter sp.]
MDLELVGRLLNLIVLVLSLTVHEFFHAWTAWRLGDDTAARMGRMTLNPIPHIDLVGTILLPLLQLPIGWAKPVPVNPANFRRGVRMAAGDTLVSVAGPLSNLGLALCSGVALGALARFAPGVVAPGSAYRVLLQLLIEANVGLAVFNLLPLPPLDGSHVLGNLLPPQWRGAWIQLQRIGPILLLVVLFLGRGLVTRIIAPPIESIVDFVYGIARSLAG